MALTLNTSHPLYSSIVAFICVDDDNVVKDLKGDTCTTDAAVVIGTGTYGRHFQTQIVSNNAKGIALTNGHLTKPVSNPVGTSMVVINAGNSRANRGPVTNTPNLGTNSIGVYTGDVAGCQNTSNYPVALGTTDVIGTGAHCIAAAWNGTSEYKTWVNGNQEAVVSGNLGSASDTAKSTYIGGANTGGFGGFAADYVYYIHFRKYLSEAELDEIYTSLGANNQISLLNSGGGTTPIAFTGTIPAQTFTNGQAVSVNLASYFTGTQTPFTFANTGTALTSTGLSISSAGLLNGTATTGSATGVIITGTDADTNTAASNAFNVTVGAAATPVSFTGTIPAITGAQNAAITPVDTSTYFSGSLTPFTYSLFSGTLPSGVTLNSSTGVISGTPTVSFSGNIVVRATDSGSNTANSNSIAVTIASAAGTITITDVVNNTNTPWTSAAVDAATVMPLSLGSVVVNKTGLSVTVGAELVITDAAIVTGTEYIIILKIGTAYGWYRAVAT